MEEKDRKGFLVLMAMLSEAFKEEMSTERAKIYFEFLKTYSLYQIMRSIKYSIRHHKFFPKVSELLDFIDPEDGYRLIETEEAMKFRLKKENKEMIEYIGKIAQIVAKRKESTVKYLELKGAQNE
jgi:hypothetical protein